MTPNRLMLLLAIAVVFLAPAFSADVTGKWTAAIDTQIGVQNYTYEFKIDAGKLTGRAKSQMGDIEITEGTVNGDEISFVENASYDGQTLRIVYKGKISGDEIKFQRNVADFVTEDFVAKRAK